MEYNITIPQKSQNMTINTLLEKEWLVPRKQRHFLRTKKNILVNDQVVNWNTEIAPCDKITIKFDQEDFPQKEILKGQVELVDCLYQDEHLIIVNKPEGMKTHPNDPNEIALLNHVSAYLNQPVYVVHRLDRETSGAILFAKNQFVLPILGKMLEDKQIYRVYSALCQGNFSKSQLTVNKPLGRDRHNKSKRVVTPSGQRALTHIKLVENFPNSSLVNCKLETGRTHQIRVHLASIGHPIIGDPLYGNPDQRLMLHAKELSLVHPFSKDRITVQAESKTFDANLHKFS